MLTEILNKAPTFKLPKSLKNQWTTPLFKNKKAQDERSINTSMTVSSLTEQQEENQAKWEKGINARTDEEISKSNARTDEAISKSEGKMRAEMKAEMEAIWNKMNLLSKEFRKVGDEHSNIAQRMQQVETKLDPIMFSLNQPTTMVAQLPLILQTDNKNGYQS